MVRGHAGDYGVAMLETMVHSHGGDYCVYPSWGLWCVDKLETIVCSQAGDYVV
jgi:hypothetical protein